MGKVYVSKNLKKISTMIKGDGYGTILSVTESENMSDDLKKKQEERARKLGFMR